MSPALRLRMRLCWVDNKKREPSAPKPIVQTHARALTTMTSTPSHPVWRHVPVSHATLDLLAAEYGDAKQRHEFDEFVYDNGTLDLLKAGKWLVERRLEGGDKKRILKKMTRVGDGCVEFEKCTGDDEQHVDRDKYARVVMAWHTTRFCYSNRTWLDVSSCVAKLKRHVYTVLTTSDDALCDKLWSIAGGDKTMQQTVASTTFAFVHDSVPRLMHYLPLDESEVRRICASVTRYGVTSDTIVTQARDRLCDPEEIVREIMEDHE